MHYSVKIKGSSPLIQHNGTSGLDPTHPANIEKKEITGKRVSKRTSVDDARLKALETLTSLWLDKEENPIIPAGALRSSIEAAARKTKRGPDVREGLQVISDGKLEYDKDKHGSTLEELCEKCQFTAPVVVQRARILRTRAKFDEWAATFHLDIDEELVDAKRDLPQWLDIAGRRIGLGDWRPQKSGHYGRFELVSIESVDQSA